MHIHTHIHDLPSTGVHIQLKIAYMCMHIYDLGTHPHVHMLISHRGEWSCVCAALGDAVCTYIHIHTYIYMHIHAHIHVCAALGDAVHIANARLAYGATNVNPIACLKGDFDSDGYFSV